MKIRPLRTVFYLISALTVFASSFVITGCEEAPPVLPGLKKSSIYISTAPEGAEIYFNGQRTGLKSPASIENIDPGFYKIEIKMTTYLDSVIYTLVSRNQDDTLSLKLREKPSDWWTVYTSSNSALPLNTINTIVIDKNDHKWLATNGKGLAIFDNNSFTVFNTANSGIPDNYVNDLLLESDGSVWVATNRGIAKFSGSEWIVYNRSNSQLPDDNVTCLAMDSRRNLWIGTFYGGLIKFDGLSMTNYNTDNSNMPVNRVASLAVDRNDQILIGTWGGGLVTFSGVTWIVNNVVTSNIGNNYVTAITIDSKFDKWIGKTSQESFQGGVAVYNDKFFLNYNAYASPLLGSIITDIAVGPADVIWIASADGGLFRFDGSKWDRYTSSNSGLPNDVVNSVAIDKNGNKWVGSGGLAKYIGGK